MMNSKHKDMNICGFKKKENPNLFSSSLNICGLKSKWLNDLFSPCFEYCSLDYLDTACRDDDYQVCFEFYLQHIVCNFAYCIVFQVTPT